MSIRGGVRYASGMPAPHMTSDEFKRLGHQLVDWVADYLDTVESRPVMPPMQPGDLFRALPAMPPQRGEPWDAILRDFRERIVPAVTHWQSPNFHGYFPCNNSGPGILGELLSAGLGINGFLWQCSPAITELEMRVTDWLGAAIGLPADFLFGDSYTESRGGGVIHGTASEATLTAMVAARGRAGGSSSSAPFVAYASSQAHSSIEKAAMVCGIGRGNVRLIGVDSALAMRPDLLEAAIRADRAAGLTPCFICATVGTTSTGAIDPVRAIGEVARRENLWLHIDAAYAGAALVCPEFRGMVEGWELADSFCFNPHKWLLTNFDCSAFWTRDRAALIDSLSITPAYLRNKATESGRTIDYRDWQIPLGRRFRALKLWFVMRHYGMEGLRAHIREHVRLAELFESLVRTDPRYEIPTPRCCSLVCFRLKGSDEANRQLVERLNANRRIHLTPTVVPVGPAGEDRTVIRMAIGAVRTEERHIRAAWDLICAHI